MVSSRSALQKPANHDRNVIGSPTSQGSIHETATGALSRSSRRQAFEYVRCVNVLRKPIGAEKEHVTNFKIEFRGDR